MPHTLTDKVSDSAQDARILELTSTVSSVPAARHVVAADLRGAGIPQPVVDNVLVIVTELVSNAILHATPLPLRDANHGILLRWSFSGHDVLVNVTDGGGAELPRRKHPVSAELEGRGLAMVDALARDWSVRAEGGRVTVQAVVGP